MTGRPRLIRFKAWLVTGTPARGLAFALDFTVGLSKAAAIAIRNMGTPSRR